MRHTRGVVWAVLLAGGCAAGKNDFSETPEDWSALVDRSVTVRGTAGNSPQGPIVRFADGGYIPLRTRERWGIDAVSRPVIVTGKVVSGQGFRAEKWVLVVDRVEIPLPEAKPVVQQGTS